MADKLLTLKEAAEYLKLSEEEIHRLVEKGEIPAYQVGGMYLRFKEEHILALKDRGHGPKEGSQPKRHRATSVAYDSFIDKLNDFVYFNDFYIISALLIILLFYIILRSIT